MRGRGVEAPRPLTKQPVRRLQLAANNNITHGHTSIGGHRSLTYKTWRAIIQRCHSPDCIAYGRYGARGVIVCERWRKFINFLEDMGERPSRESTIDRIDNSKGYEPGNCRWANRVQQARNRSITRTLEYKGEIKPLAEWAEIVGLNFNCLRKRISVGWPIEAALKTPILTKRECSARGHAARWALSEPAPSTPSK